MNVWPVWMGFISVKGSYAKFYLIGEKKWKFLQENGHLTHVKCLLQGKVSYGYTFLLATEGA